MDSITISIADIPVTLVLDDCDDTSRAWIIDRYAAFTVFDRLPRVSIRVRVEKGPLYIPIGTAATYQIRTTVHDGRIDFTSYYEIGWMDRTTGQAEIVMRPGGSTENFLRVLYAWLGLEQNMLVLHACGVISKGRGFVFFGPSGSGKTTVARLSSDRTVLSDDIVIIREVAGVYRVYGVPFRGDFPEAPRTNASADLLGLSILVKSAEHRLVPVVAPEAVARLSACVPFVMTHHANVQRVMDICRDLVARVPVRALHFRRDAEFWRILDGLE